MASCIPIGEDLTNKEIFENVTLILTDKSNGLNEKELCEKYDTFTTRYPGIFRMVYNSTDVDNDVNQLMHMLDMQEKIRQGRMCQKDADKKVGQDLYNRFN